MLTSHKGNFIVLVHRERKIPDSGTFIGSTPKIDDLQDIVAYIPGRFETDIGEAAGGGNNIVQLELFQYLLSGSSLTGFGGVGCKALNELFQVPRLVFLEALLILLLLHEYLVHPVP